MPHREATRLVSASQPGAALNVTLPPDTTVSHSLVPSPEYLTRLQRRLGLYLTALSPILDARAARGVNVSEHEYLGDACLLDANHTSRHDAGLHAVHGALASLKTEGLPIRLGDRGDGTKASEAEALARHAYLNKDHVPDMYRTGSPNVLWEFK